MGGWMWMDEEGHGWTWMDKEGHGGTRLNGVEGVERYLPGLAGVTNGRFRTPDGKSENQIAFSGEAKNEKHAMGMIHETHEAWCSLTNDETPPGDTSMYSVANHVQSRDKALVYPPSVFSDHPFNQEVIREIEEEAEEPGADDDIVLLRSPTADQRQQTVNDEDHSEREDDEGAFTVTALSHDDNGVGQPSTRLSPLMHEASKRMSPPPGYPDTSRECNAP